MMRFSRYGYFAVVFAVLAAILLSTAYFERSLAGDHGSGSGSGHPTAPVRLEDSTRIGRLADSLGCPNACGAVMANLQCAIIALKEAFLRWALHGGHGKASAPRHLRNSPNTAKFYSAYNKAWAGAGKEAAQGELVAIVASVFNHAWEHLSEEVCRSGGSNIRTPRDFANAFWEQIKKSAKDHAGLDEEAMKELGWETFFHQGEGLGPLGFLALKDVFSADLNARDKEAFLKGVGSQAENIGKGFTLAHVVSHCGPTIGCGLLRLGETGYLAGKEIGEALEQNRELRDQLDRMLTARDGSLAVRYGTACKKDRGTLVFTSRGEYCKGCCDERFASYCGHFPDRGQWPETLRTNYFLVYRDVCRNFCNENANDLDAVLEFGGVLFDQEYNRFKSEILGR